MMITASRICIILCVVCLAAMGCRKKGYHQNAVHVAPKVRIEVESEVKELNGNIPLTELKLDIDAITRATPGYNRDGVRPPHFRKERKRSPFMVVPGVKNLALYKPVTASDEPTVGELEQLTDGLKTSGEFDFVAGPGWVQVDLGEPASIHAIVVWHFYKNPIIFDDVIVRVSDDVGFSRNVRTLFNNDHDNSSGMGKGKDGAFISRWWGEIIDARGPAHAGTTARFVRVYTGKSVDGVLPMYVEIDVYGMRNPNGIEERTR